MRAIGWLIAGYMLVNSGILAPAADLPPTQPSAAEEMNRFATDLYGRLSAGQGNLIYSPLSVHAALMMTAAGARGETAAQMSKVLGVPDLSSPQAHAAESLLLAQL